MELQQTQTQKLSQRQLYSVELLRLSTLELEGYVRELAQENPLVELEEVSAQPQGEGKDDLLGRLRWRTTTGRTGFIRSSAMKSWTLCPGWAPVEGWKRRW